MVSVYIGLSFPLLFTTSVVIGADVGWRTTRENDDVVVEPVWWEMGVVSER